MYLRRAALCLLRLGTRCQPGGSLQSHSGWCQPGGSLQSHSGWCQPGGSLRSHSGWCRYRAVIFEAVGMLLPSPARTAAEWEAQHWIPAGTIQQALHSGGENSPSGKYSRGELTAVEFLQELGQQCFEIANVRVPVDSFLSDLIKAELIKQLPMLAEAAQCIRAEGLRTALLSTSFCLPAGESSLPLDPEHFDVMIESPRGGLCQPDPGIYSLCLERLGVQPQESIFLDSSSQNIKAAAQLGIQTLKVDDPEVALKELETYLGFPLQGFVPYTCSVRPGMEIPQDRLQKYLENVLGVQARGPPVLRQFGHGPSARTYCVQFGDHLLVLKKEPSARLCPSGSAVGREYRVLKALSEAGVPVPTVLALCEDKSTLGTPFYLMEHCAGCVYRDLSLPTLQPGQRRALYAAMSQVLSTIHSVDLRAAKLEDLGEHGNYIQQEVEAWTKQYRAMETHVIPAMERLIQWLPLHFPESQKTTVVHGDFRMDNLIFHPDRPEVLAVLGWKHSTLGDPISDLANNCMAYFLPPHFNALRGLRKCDLGSLGVPTAEEYSQIYWAHMGGESPENWNFYLAFAFFRLAATLQGLYKHSRTGEAAGGESKREDAEFVAELAWEFAIKEGFRVFGSLPTRKPLARGYSTWARCGLLLSRSSGTRPHPGPAPPEPKVPLITPPHQLHGDDAAGSSLEAGKDPGSAVEFSDFPAQMDPSGAAGEISSSLKQLGFAGPAAGWVTRADLALLITSDTWHSRSPARGWVPIAGYTLVPEFIFWEPAVSEGSTPFQEEQLRASPAVIAGAAPPGSCHQRSSQSLAGFGLFNTWHSSACSFPSLAGGNLSAGFVWKS